MAVSSATMVTEYRRRLFPQRNGIVPTFTGDDSDVDAVLATARAHPAGRLLNRFPNSGRPDGPDGPAALLSELCRSTVLPVPPIPTHGLSDTVTHVDVNAEATALAAWGDDIDPTPPAPGWSRIAVDDARLEALIAAVWPRTVFAAEFISTAVVPSLRTGVDVGDAYPHLYTALTPTFGPLNNPDPDPNEERLTLREAVLYGVDDLWELRARITAVGAEAFTAAAQPPDDTADGDDTVEARTVEARTVDHTERLLANLSARRGNPTTVFGYPFTVSPNIAASIVHNPHLWNRQWAGAVHRNGNKVIVTTNDPLIALPAVFVSRHHPQIEPLFLIDKTPRPATLVQTLTAAFAQAFTGNPNETLHPTVANDVFFAVGIIAVLNATIE